MPSKYYYRKPHRIKKKKSVLKNRFFWLGFLVLTAIGATSSFLFFSGIFQIQEVTITGAEKVSKENIRAFIPQKNIFLIDTSKIEKSILGHFFQIASVKIHRAFPGALNILITERLAIAVWCEQDRCFAVDNEGTIFEEVEGLAPSEVEGLIKITGAKELFDKEKISQILEIQGKLKENLIATTTKAIIVSEERLNIKTSEGWEIYLNSKGDLDWQLQKLKLVLEKQMSPEKRRNLEYIDLRFSRVYYK